MPATYQLLLTTRYLRYYTLRYYARRYNALALRATHLRTYAPTHLLTYSPTAYSLLLTGHPAAARRLPHGANLRQQALPARLRLPRGAAHRPRRGVRQRRLWRTTRGGRAPLGLGTRGPAIQLAPGTTREVATTTRGPTPGMETNNGNRQRRWWELDSRGYTAKAVFLLAPGATREAATTIPGGPRRRGDEYHFRAAA